MKIKVLREPTSKEKAHIWRNLFKVIDVEEVDTQKDKQEERERLCIATDRVLAIIVKVVNYRGPEKVENADSPWGVTFTDWTLPYDIYSDDEFPLKVLFKLMEYCHRKGIWNITM